MTNLVLGILTKASIINTAQKPGQIRHIHMIMNSAPQNVSWSDDTPE